MRMGFWGGFLLGAGVLFVTQKLTGMGVPKRKAA